MRKRQTNKTLSHSRIYIRGKRFCLFSAEAIINPKTGKVAKWHSLCLVDDGELKARELAHAIQTHNMAGTGAGDFKDYFETYRLAVLKKREKDKPTDKPRLRMFEEGAKEISRKCKVISEAFSDFDVEQIMPVDVAKFLDQWEGQRTAQIYRSRFSDFFAWACRKGIRSDNPCREVQVERPASRARYIEHKEFHAIRDALAIGKDGKKTPSGEMMQCYVDLLYLLYQRTTDVRLLKWSDVSDGFINFKPTKTEKSSNISVKIPISPPIQAVLDRAKAIGLVKGLYVIHTIKGQPYATRGVGTAWTRACERAGIANATLKDLRAKALTDAKKAGYTIEQLSVAAAHTDAQMTGTYIKRREVSSSEVVMALPPMAEK